LKKESRSKQDPVNELEREKRNTEGRGSECRERKRRNWFRHFFTNSKIKMKKKHLRYEMNNEI